MYLYVKWMSWTMYLDSALGKNAKWRLTTGTPDQRELSSVVVVDESATISSAWSVRWRSLIGAIVANPPFPPLRTQ